MSIRYFDCRCGPSLVAGFFMRGRMDGMAWDIFFLMLGPTLAIAALLLTRRLVTRNWQFSFRGLLMLLTLAAEVWVL